MHGWFRHYNQVFSVTSFAGGVVAMFALLFYGYRHRRQGPWWPLTTMTRKLSLVWYKSLIGAGFLAFYIVVIEVSLYWSHVKGIYNLHENDQLIPLVIGIGVLIDWATSAFMAFAKEYLLDSTDQTSDKDVELARVGQTPAAPPSSPGHLIKWVDETVPRAARKQIRRQHEPRDTSTDSSEDSGGPCELHAMKNQRRSTT